MVKVLDSTRGRWGVPNTAAVSIPSELAFDRVSHVAGGNTILDNITLTAQTGTVTCLLGPSGSGKTTLLRIAAGMERQTDGRVLQDGREISGPDRHVPPEKRGIGLVFQDYALFPHMTILENVCFGLKHLKKAERVPQALQMLTRVGLRDRAEDHPTVLSGGEQQRVALARAMAPRPGVLLMDEPFSGLDSRLRETVRDETLAVLRETRATSVIVTHDPEEALQMGDRIALMNQGRLEQVGTCEELYFRPTSLFAAGFFSELNLLEGMVVNGRVMTPLGDFEAEGFEETDKVVVAIRTGALSLERGGIGPQGRVLTRRFLGDTDHLTVGVSGLESPLTLRVQAGSFVAGEGAKTFGVRVDPRGCFVFAAVPS